MSKLQYSITINAPKTKVWNTMLDDATYRVWAEEFMAGSHYVGNWSHGSKILFLAPHQNSGKMEGIVSRIQENRLHEYISIEHMGVVKDGKEDMTSEKAKEWAGVHENYTFNDNNGSTDVVVDMDYKEEFKEMLDDTWPKALQKLKELAEG